MISESIYAGLPEYFQNTAVSIAGYRTSWTRYGKEFYVSLESLLERSEWSTKQILEYRNNKLIESLERASHTPYYSKFLLERDWKWEKLVDPRFFIELPVINKNLVRKNIDSFRPRPAIKSDRRLQTSGTTGQSLTLFESKNIEPLQWAVWWRYRSWHGINRGTKCALFASAPVIPNDIDKMPFRFDRASNEYRFSIFHISEDTAPLYVSALNSIKPQWVHGNPTALAELSSHIVNSNLNLNLNLKIVSVGSENLLYWQRQIIQKAFKANVFEHYALAERVANISQCENGNLHIDEDFSFVELLEADENSVCSIVGTPFDNYALSLLRFDTGDLASLKGNNCSCKHPGRVVDSLDGRTTDYVTLPNGRRIASLAAPFHACDNLAGAQIYQAPSGELTVRYIPSIGWGSSDLSNLKRALRLRVGDEINISFREVKSLQKTKRGKMKLVLSDFAS